MFGDLTYLGDGVNSVGRAACKVADHDGAPLSSSWKIHQKVDRLGGQDKANRGSPELRS